MKAQKWVDAAVGAICLFGAACCLIGIDIGAGRLAVADVLFGFMLVMNAAGAVGGFYRAMGPKAGGVVFGFIFLTTFFSFATGSIVSSAISVLLIFAIIGIWEAYEEGRDRRRAWAERVATRMTKPGRRGMTVKTPSARLRARGAKCRVTFYPNRVGS